MTSKERVRAAISFQKTDRPPFNFWMDRRLMRQYEERFGPDYRAAHYGADVIETFLNVPFPSGRVVEASGSYWLVEPLLDDIRKAKDLELADVDQLDVCAGVRSDLQNFPDKFVILDVAGVFSVMDGIRGPEGFLMDIYDHPEELRALLDRIADTQARAVRKACELPIDAFYTMDDIGTSKGLFASPSMLKEWVFDFNARSVKVALEAGKPVWMHSDGGIMDALDTIVEMGVSVINPLEPRLNDLPRFARDYQSTRKLAVYGALDTYGIIPYGTLSEVRQHVRETYELLGRDGGLIFSTHDIPMDAPPENVEAMVDEIKRCGG